MAAASPGAARHEVIEGRIHTQRASDQLMTKDLPHFWSPSLSHPSPHYSPGRLRDIRWVRRPTSRWRERNGLIRVCLYRLVLGHPIPPPGGTIRVLSCDPISAGDDSSNSPQLRTSPSADPRPGLWKRDPIAAQMLFSRTHWWRRKKARQPPLAAASCPTRHPGHRRAEIPRAFSPPCPLRKTPLGILCDFFPTIALCS